MKTIFDLTQTQDGKTEIKFSGQERSCFFKLQRIQGHSADWAMKYEGWKITEREVTEEEYSDIISKDPWAKKL